MTVRYFQFTLIGTKERLKKDFITRVLYFLGQMNVEIEGEAEVDPKATDEDIRTFNILIPI